MLDCQLDAAERAQPQPELESKSEKPRRKFVGFSEQVRLQQEANRNRTGPDPWLTRKVSNQFRQLETSLGDRLGEGQLELIG